jgi:hypothetical protein
VLQISSSFSSEKNCHSHVKMVCCICSGMNKYIIAETVLAAKKNMLSTPVLESS